jgi:amino acid adenylation domain-containing protein
VLHPVPVSARGPEALQASARSLREFLATCPERIGLSDIAAAAVRRSQHEHRLVIVTESKEDLARQLEAFATADVTSGRTDWKSVPRLVSGRAVPGQRRRLAFVCSGQGPQWWAMGRQLLDQEPVFREIIERCDDILSDYGDWSLLDELRAEERRSRMAVTAIAQPAIFALQVALAALWRSWGIEPEVVVGHSVGEVATAHLAGIFSLEDAARIIYERGRCMGLAPARGRMLAAGLPLDEALRLVAPHGTRIAIAAINSPALVTLSGEADTLEEIARQLERQQVFCRFLQVPYAFHSAQMDPIRDELIASLHGIQPRQAKLPFLSAVTGKYSAGPELGPEYWWHNVRQPVQFVDTVDGLIDLECTDVLELSPHPVLASAVAECYQKRGKEVNVLFSLRRREDERASMLHSLGVLHTRGYEVSWPAVVSAPRHWANLPLYPWQRERCWFEPEESRSARLAAVPHPLLGCAQGEPTPAWATRLDVRLLPYLADHRVQKVSIMPAAAYVEMAIAVAREALHPSPATEGESGDGAVACQIEDLRLLSPCFLTADKALRCQTRYDDGRVQIHTRPAEADPEWTLHGNAVLRPLSGAPPASISLDAVRERCPRRFAREECYRHFHELELDYGPMFQLIEQAWQGERESLGVLRLPETVDSDTYIIHPALLDACFQVALVADGDLGDDDRLYVPVEIERVRLYARPGRRLCSHARLLEKSAKWSVADIDIYDESGIPLLQVRGLRSQRVRGTGADESLDDLLYAYEWQLQQSRPELVNGAARKTATAQPSSLRNEEKQSDGGAGGHWLIFADSRGIGTQLAECLQGRGGVCSLVWPGSTFARRAANQYEVDPAVPQDMCRILETVMGSCGLRGIVHLWNLDAPPADSLDSRTLQAAQDVALLSVLHLVQAWNKTADDLTSSLVVVACGAQSVGPAPQALAVAQAPVIGLGRVIVSEYPRLLCKLVDLDPAGADVGLLTDELFLTDDEDEIALRGANRYVHRYIPLRERAAAVAAPANASYRLTTRQPGNLDGLILQASRRRQPGPGEVEIEVAAAGLNFSDVMKVLAIYPGLADGAIPFGAECSGVITAVGAGVDGLEVGIPVVAAAPCALASHVITRAELVVAKPPQLDFVEAATVPIAFLTAAYTLEYLARLGPGERVLIHSASGGVGQAALQLARRAGAEIFATAGSSEKRDLLRALGIKHVMDSRSLSFADEVLEQTGDKGVDVILNSLPGEAIARGLSALSDNGRFLELGKRDIYQNSRIGLGPFRKNLSFFAIDLDRLLHERPAFLGGMLKSLIQDVAAGRLSPLPHRVFPIADVTAAFRHMQQGKHVGKIVLSMAEKPTAVAAGEDEELVFHADASYLITGGLGGFGLAVAGWLVERGARYLVLVGRRGIHGPGVEQALNRLEERGARVTVMRADIAKEEDVTRLLAAMDASLPPLRGIFHAAMVLEDALLTNLDGERLRRVLAPKVAGTWNLHRQTLGRPLDHFVLFSSLSSVFGHAGQGNYAAANAFLDAMCHYRRALGLPALTINWGYLGGVGYLAERPALGARLEQQGVKSFSIREALDLLERALRRQLVQVSVMRVDWSRWRGLGVTGRVSPRFAHLCRQAQTSGAGHDAAATTLDRLTSAAPQQRRDLLRSLLHDRLARLLGIDSTRLQADRPLLQLGLDSLMALELRHWIDAELRVNLPVMDLMHAAGLAGLTQVLLERLPAGPGNSAPEQRNGHAPDLTPSTPAQNLFPLAHGQRGLWFLFQMDRDSAAYNVCYALKICSQLDSSALRRALQVVVDRHPSLRTTFEEQAGELRQRVHERMPIALEILDAATWSEEMLRLRLEEEARCPFDLETGPLLRMYLFTRAPAEHVFLLTVHHIIGDLASLLLVLEEMRVLYPALRGGKPLALPPLKFHYGDFVRWQTDMLAGPEGERHWSYWRQQLADVAHVLELPLARPRPPRFSYRGAAVPCRLGPELTRRLQAFAVEEQVTPYMILLAAFEALLGRYTSCDHFVVGSPFAGRSRSDFERIVGYFINMVPVRADVSGNPSFRDLLHRVSATVVDALEHQDYPFALLVERLKVARDPSRTPLVQVSFTLEKLNRAGDGGTFRLFDSERAGSTLPSSAGDLHMQPCYVEQRICKADLEMVLEEGDDTIEGMLNYCSDILEGDSVSRMVGHYQTLLKAALVDPDRPVAELPLLRPAEQQQVLHEWGRVEGRGARDEGREVCDASFVHAPSSLSPGRTVHELFEQQAQRTPSAPAISCAERITSYAELDAWAERLADPLRALGAGPGRFVALCLERSPEMVAAVLATLKTAAACVPLDPDSPHERLRVLLADTRPALLLTKAHALDRLRRLDPAVTCLAVDDGCAVAAGSGLNEKTTGAVADGVLAYVIYTSGSSGRPKGVMIEHRAICNTLRWRQQTLPIGEGDRLLLTLPGFFDAGLGAILWTLGSGAQLVLPEPGAERDPVRLLDDMTRAGITVLQLLPSMLQLLLDTPGFAAAGRSLRQVCCGGEVMPADLPERFFAQVDAQLYNLYGPTEAAVDATWFACRRGQARHTIPIGRPIANVQAYVLDTHRQPLPAGVPGELYIGGEGLARGYLNDPELTADRFLGDPFSSAPTGRLYKTGDRCRWLPDGQLEFLGRLDRQVKVRGYRLEPAEIEAALVSHPDIREAAVDVRTTAAGDDSLVAYVVTAEQAPSTDSLHRYLEERLPRFMVPFAFVILPALPRTASGKLDRQALPMPSEARASDDPPRIAARNPLEEFLVILWQEVLGVTPIGVADNFFDRGGNSLQAAVLINRLQQKLGARLYLVALFEAPTIAGLASYLAGACPEIICCLFGSQSLSRASVGAARHGKAGHRASASGDLIIPLQPNGSRPACFLVHPPGGIVICYRALAQRLGRDQPCHGIRARGLYGEQDLPATLEDMAADYLDAIRAVQPHGPYHLAGWSLGGVVAFEMAQQLVERGQEVGVVALLDTTIPFGPQNRRYWADAEQSGQEYGLDVSLDQLAQLGADEQLPYLWEHARKLGLIEDNTPAPLVRQLLDELKRLFHAHVRLVRDYVVRPYPGRLVLFRPAETPVARATPADRGWSQLAHAVTVHVIPGQHHTMVKEPHVQVLARKLRRFLRRQDPVAEFVRIQPPVR